MASKSLGTLTIDLVAKIGGFTAGLDKASREADKKSKGMIRNLDGMKKAAAAWGVAFGAALSAVAVGLAYNTKQAIDNADALDEMSQRTGIAVETLSRLQLAAEFGAVEMEDLQKAVGRLAVQQQNVAEGNEDSVALFKALGVAAVDAEGGLRDTEQVLVDLADVFASMPDGPQKTALAIDLLGKSGQNLIPFLNQGSEKLEELNQIADELGITISSETAAAASEFNDQLFLLEKASDGLYAALAADLLPELVELVQVFTDNVREGGGMVEIAHDIADAIRGIADVAHAAGIGIEIMGESLRIAGLWGKALLDSSNAAEYNKQVQQSIARIEALGEASERTAKQARVHFGIDDAEPESGGSTGSPNGRGRGVPVDIKRETGDLEEYAKRREAAAAAARAQADGERAAADATREAAAAQAELDRQMEQNKQTRADFLTGLDDMEAQLSGPLAEATLQHKRDIAEVQKLLDAGIISVEEATRAQMDYAESFAKTQDAIDPYGAGLRALLEDMAFEYDMLGKTNAQRVAENELRRLGIDLTTQQGQATLKMVEAEVEAYEARREAISAMDDFRSSFEDNVASVLDGSKSIKDAFKDMVKDLLAQMARLAAERFTEQLLGAMGTDQTGSAGGGFMALFSSFFKARASGGPVMSGVPYLVGEQGPELVIPKSAGTVIPAGQTAAMMSRTRGSGGMTVIVQGSTSRQALRNIDIAQQRRQRDAVGEFA